MSMGRNIVADITYIPVKEFRKFGFLQELNRKFLHPLGLALEVSIDEEGGETLVGIWDYREEDGGMIYADSVILEKDFQEKIERVAEFQRKKHKERQEAMGWVIQPGEI
jgi:hypothetical protein